MPKKFLDPSRDPHAKRESTNYDNPVASREYLLDLIQQQAKPVTHEELVAELNYSNPEQIEAVRRRLMAMVRDGQIFRNRRGGFLSFDHMDLVTGKVQAHPDGFGFLTPDSGGKDIFLPARQMRTLLDGDRAAVKITQIDKTRDRKEGAVVSVLERAHKSIIGRYHKEHGIDLVVPDDKRLTEDILLNPDVGHSAEPGDIVLVTITDYPSRHSPAVGLIETVLGADNAPGMEVTIAINSHNIPYQWNDAVLAETGKFSTQVEETDKKGKLDLRKLPFVTIDGSDARDFDDALYCEPAGDSFRLYVAIADVSHYVSKGSALDQEAIQRGTSVYFPGEVIPMLPEVLSNGLCSLNPKVDRLCLVCEMDITASGAIESYRFHETVIHSHARLIYDDVAAVLFEGKNTRDVDLNAVLESLKPLKAVYHALNKARQKRHAIEFDTKEVSFVYNENRKIEAIKPLVRNDAHKMIEECMIAANICAARFLKKHKIPNLYRCHEGANPDKLNNLYEFLASYGIHMKGEKPTPAEYDRVIREIKPLPEFQMLQTVILRSMMQANYSPDTKMGHFGLALQDYAHFTSPIRRYPDLMIHRGIRHILRGGTKQDFSYTLADVTALGETCSQYERRADLATRDAADFLKCEFLQKHVGDEFCGLVTAVTSFGLFVQLDDLMIEGLVHVTALKRDYYQFDAAKHRMVGERSGRVFQLGDKFKVRVVRVDMEDRKIDFDLVEQEKRSFLQSGKKMIGKVFGRSKTATKEDEAFDKKKKRRKKTKVKNTKSKNASTATGNIKPQKATQKRRKSRTKKVKQISDN